MDVSKVDLVFWAANVAGHDLLTGAEGVAEGGFSSISVLTGQLEAWEAEGRTLENLRDEMAARGAPISAVDPYLAWYPGYDINAATGEAAAHLRASEDDVLRYAEALGVTFVTVVGPFSGPDGSFDEAVENLGRLADRTAEIGVRPHLEIIPTTKVPDLETGMKFVQAVNRPNFGLLLDTYNLGRSGMDPAELDRVPLEMIFQIQLADAAAEPKGTDYFDDAFHYRELPGQGELQVAEMVSRIAAKGPLPPTGPEVFSDAMNARSASEAGRVSGEVCRDFLAGIEV
jgi:sugar phosphate isomerase/epimerase